MTAKWGEITAREITAPIQGELVSGPPEAVLGGLSTDSRKITPGQLFWALKGETYDGHDFLRQAIDEGAAGVVMERGYMPETPAGRHPVLIAVTDTLKALGDLGNWWRRQHPVPVAAVTGSVGKTTTKEMAASILGLHALTLKNEGNLNNLIGLPLTLLLLEDAHRRAVVEMGMNRPGEIARLTEIAEPNIGCITNVARAHLAGLGSVEAVARAKVEMLEKIPKEGQAILNGDDALLMKVASPLRKKIITYGVGSGHSVRADKIRSLGKEGTSFELQYFGHSEAIRLRVPGPQNVLNALAASAIALCLDESPDRIAEGLNRFEGIEGRFMITHLPRGITLVDDTYNSNPSSLRAAIEAVKELVADGGRVIVGLGEMLELGEETVIAHLEAGNMVAELGASYLAAMGEHAAQIIEGAVSQGFPRDRAMAVNSHEEMVQQIDHIIKGGELILLKGSRQGHLEKVAEGLRRKRLEKV